MRSHSVHNFEKVKSDARFQHDVFGCSDSWFRVTRFEPAMSASGRGRSSATSGRSTRSRRRWIQRCSCRAANLYSRCRIAGGPFVLVRCSNIEEGTMARKASVMTTDLPGGIGKPATRALVLAGVTSLAQLTRFTEAEVSGLHGVGPKAIRILRDALMKQGKSFAKKG